MTHKIDHLKHNIQLTKQIDTLRTNYVELQDVVRNLVVRDKNNCWKLNPEARRLATGEQSITLHKICVENKYAEDVLIALKKCNLINLDTEESTDQTDIKDNDN
jgi:hypothetical protein